MSLFKSREWWSTNCGVQEAFGAYHMCIATYEREDNGDLKQVIIVGSMEGYLRIYDPQQISTSDETSTSSDMQLETQLALPILAIQSGRFNNTEGLHVAVLHPKHLRILRVIIHESSEVNSHCIVDLMYEHQLPMHGYTLTTGPSWLCVQSLTEGTLMFFENERAGVTCKLPTLHLLPSPICYVPSSESFIVCDSSWNLHSYNYQSLANSTLDQQMSRTPNALNKVLSDWELELNEPAIDLKSIGSFVIVLSERHLYCLKESGSITWMRKLDYHPMCCHVIIPPDFPESVVVLVCTDANTLLVYKDNIVEWNCKLPFSPIVIKTATLQSTEGLIVTLSDVGHLNVSFMGTQQVKYGFLQAPQRPINYKKGMKEIEQLTQSLRTGQLKDLNMKVKEELELNLKLESHTSKEYLDNTAVDAIKGNLQVVIPTNPKGEVRVFFKCDPLITVIPSEAIVLLDNEGTAEVAVLFHATTNKNGIVTSLQVETSAISLLAGTSSITRFFSLPLNLVTKLGTPVREALIKVTLSTNQPAVNLVQLFQDFSVEESMTNVIALEHLNGAIVSILVSKTTNKYRLQSDSLAALALLIVEIEKRLRRYFTEIKFQMVLDSALPVQDVWSQIEAHYMTCNNLIKEMNNLSQAVQQFQVIQRVFHNKILNTKTSDLTQGIFTALQLAHDHVTTCIDTVEKSQEAFLNATHSLRGAVLCVLSLLNLGSNDAKQQSLNLLEKALLPIEQLDLDQPWHNCADRKLRYLMRQRTHSSNPPTAASSEKEFTLQSFKKIFFQTFDAFIKDPQP